ncbi:hypothetical protein P1X15_07180 [Runella sp. MFBS21]|uniref:hypothetical protein n=1 Tax=Runella sp. MFBS21 TaxID=3034018 RepID=UPI0023F76C8D|nr:hypothetical protein [Runella sp. MFBS21]MDF7817369.1 hypothetical protein [Runella sp. MFBS21]
MDTEVKRQIEKEISRCNRRIKWAFEPQHYWMERKAILMNSLHYGFEVALGDIEKTLSQSSKYMESIIRANQDTLSDIQNKWAK